MRLEVSLKARQDLEDTFVRGAADFGLDAAARYVDELAEVLGLLTDRPHLGRERAEVSPPVRLHRHRAHNILYDVHDDRIVILRILHGSANWIDHL